MLNAADVPLRVPSVTTTRSGDEAVLMLPALGQLNVLNELGARVWDLADGSRSVGDIVSVVCEEYDVAREHAEADTLAFVAELQGKGLLLLKAGA